MSIGAPLRNRKLLAASIRVRSVVGRLRDACRNVSARRCDTARGITGASTTAEARMRRAMTRSRVPPPSSECDPSRSPGRHSVASVR